MFSFEEREDGEGQAGMWIAEQCSITIVLDEGLGWMGIVYDDIQWKEIRSVIGFLDELVSARDWWFGHAAYSAISC